jgi:hypothetical protein
MFRASRYPVEGGDDKHCELPLPGFTQHRIEPRTPSLGAGDADIGEFRHDFKTTLSGELSEVV